MKKFSALLIAALVLFVPGANAQLATGSSISVSVVVNVTSSITLSTSGGSLNFDGTTGTTNNIAFATSWSLGPTTSIKLYTWFSSPTAALSTGPANIPASQIAATFQSPGTSGSGTPCNQAFGVGNGVIDGASCSVIDVGRGSDGSTPNPAGNNNGSANVTYSLSILNFPTYKTTIGAGAYTGTLSAIVISI